MDIIVRLVSFFGMLISLGCAIFVFLMILEEKKMHKTNQEIEEYIKSKDFLLMKNDGESPCDIKDKLKMPSFSQESSVLIRREYL